MVQFAPKAYSRHAEPRYGAKDLYSSSFHPKATTVSLPAQYTVGDQHVNIATQLYTVPRGEPHDCAERAKAADPQGVGEVSEGKTPEWSGAWNQRCDCGTMWNELAEPRGLRAMNLHISLYHPRLGFAQMEEVELMAFDKCRSASLRCKGPSYHNADDCPHPQPSLNEWLACVDDGQPIKLSTGSTRAFFQSNSAFLGHNVGFASVEMLVHGGNYCYSNHPSPHTSSPPNPNGLEWCDHFGLRLGVGVDLVAILADEDYSISAEALRWQLIGDHREQSNTIDEMPDQTRFFDSLVAATRKYTEDFYDENSEELL